MFLSCIDEQFNLYDGVELSSDEILGWSSFITKRTFDCDSTSLTTALPNEYIEKMLNNKKNQQKNKEQKENKQKKANQKQGTKKSNKHTITPKKQ